MKLKLAIFDLDGTLLNTIADLAASTNQALGLCGFPQHQTEEYRYFVGNGINKLFERALPEEKRTEENIMRIRELFIPYYDVHNAVFSQPYPGVADLLEELQAKGIHLAVASNKYQSATEKLVSHYFPTIKFDVVLGQRDNVPVKPHPQIVHDILRVTGCRESETIYIGDSGVDMQTANNATVTGIGVTWGFRPKEELLQHSPTHIVDTTLEIHRIIQEMI